MNWGTVILFVAVGLFFLLPRLSQVSKKEAVQLLKQGAAFIDVRTRGEFAQQSLPGSRNVPVQELAQAIQKQKLATDDPILVFCQSGMRSASAKRQLRSLGYTQVRNVGSFSRAHSVWQLSHSKPQ